MDFMEIVKSTAFFIEVICLVIGMILAGSARKGKRRGTLRHKSIKARYIAALVLFIVPTIICTLIIKF